MKGNTTQRVFILCGIITLTAGGVFLYHNAQKSLAPSSSSTPTTSLAPTTSTTPSLLPSTTPSSSSTSTPIATPTATPKPIPSPSATPKPTPPPVIPDTYTVVSGDTLSSIARKFGLSLSTLEALNPQISNPNLIYPGQVLKLKGTVPPNPPAEQTKASVIYRIQTTKPVVFLTIDDGIYKDPKAAELMSANGLVASFFLTYTLIQDNPGYFANLSKVTGSLIEGHTYSHQNLVTLSYAEQKAEIQKGLDKLEQTFGRRPTFVRPPYGNFNDDTRRAAASLGISTLVHWSVTVDSGKLAYASGNHLRSGDIVLMHFRPTFEQDITAFLNEMKAQGLHTELLENWVTN